MEALLIVLLFFAAVFIYGTLDEELEKKTGRNIGGWVGHIILTFVFIAMAAGGIYLIITGTSENSIGPIFFGFMLFMLGVLGAQGAFKDW